MREWISHKNVWPVLYWIAIVHVGDLLNNSLSRHVSLGILKLVKLNVGWVKTLDGSLMSQVGNDSNKLVVISISYVRVTSMHVRRA